MMILTISDLNPCLPAVIVGKLIESAVRADLRTGGRLGFSPGWRTGSDTA